MHRRFGRLLSIGLAALLLVTGTLGGAVAAPVAAAPEDRVVLEGLIARVQDDTLWMVLNYGPLQAVDLQTLDSDPDSLEVGRWARVEALRVDGGFAAVQATVRESCTNSSQDQGACDPGAIGGTANADSVIATALAQASLLATSDDEALDATVLFEDQPANPDSRLGLYSAEDGTSEYTERGQWLFVSGPENYIYSTTTGRGLADVRIEADITRTAGAATDLVGLICRFQDTGNFYAVAVSADGLTYGIARFKDQFPTWIAVQSGRSSALQPAPATNHLRADCVGDTITLSVNGQPLLQAHDEEFQSGEIGVLAQTLGHAGLELQFESFVALAPDQSPTPPTADTLLLADPLTDPSSGWPEGSYPEGILEYVESGYRMFITAPDSERVSRPLGGYGFPGEVSVEVDATFVGGPQTGYAGLQCRDTTSQTYTALVGADGFYAFYRWDGVEYVQLSGDWQPHPAINVGNATNHLQLDCLSGTLKLFVNGQLVQRVEDQEVLPQHFGSVALVAGSPQLEGGTDVVFSNFSVKQL